MLLGAYASFVTGKWPIFMPFQLDAVFGLLGIFNEGAGGYLGGSFLLLFGALSLYGGASMLVEIVSSSRKSRHARDLSE